MVHKKILLLISLAAVASTFKCCASSSESLISELLTAFDARNPQAINNILQQSQGTPEEENIKATALGLANDLPDKVRCKKEILALLRPATSQQDLLPDSAQPEAPDAQKAPPPSPELQEKKRRAPTTITRENSNPTLTKSSVPSSSSSAILAAATPHVDGEKDKIIEFLSAIQFCSPARTRPMLKQYPDLALQTYGDQPLLCYIASQYPDCKPGDHADQIIELLINARASLEEDSSGRDPFAIAQECQKPGIVDALLRHQTANIS